jgi:DNA-binding Xre family transcriptional regulator
MADSFPNLEYHAKISKTIIFNSFADFFIDFTAIPLYYQLSHSGTVKYTERGLYMVQKKIKEYLDSHGIKAIKIARDIGLSQSTFSAIINGQRNLRVDEFFAICKALGVSPEVFDPDKEFA